MKIYSIDDNGHRVLLVCREEEDGGLTLLRAWGELPVLHIDSGPGQELGIKRIAPYCFSQLQKSIELETPPEAEGLSELAGLALEELRLPDSLVELGDYAFYNCRKLARISVGPDLKQVHSDVFMNCTNLHSLEVRGQAEEESGLANLLSRINTSLEVRFALAGQGVTGRLFYPEFSMNYEAVYAAHIFQMRVDGSGYGPRQAFRGQRVDYPAYDEAIQNAFPIEDVQTLVTISADRILYPYGLTDGYRDLYMDYIRKHDREACLRLIDRDEEDLLKGLIKGGLISPGALRAAIDHARTTGKLRLLMGIMGR